MARNDCGQRRRWKSRFRHSSNKRPNRVVCGRRPRLSTDAGAITLGQTHLVTATWAADRATLYVDGVEAASQDSPDAVPLINANPLYIGSFAGVLAFNGTIDDVQIYDRVLPADEVLFLKDNPGQVIGGSDSDGGGDASMITWGAVNTNTTLADLIGGPSITFTPFEYDGGNAEGTFLTGDGGTSGDDVLDSVYNSHGWNADGATITLSGLTAGESFQVQLLGAGDTRDCCNTRNQAASDGQGNVSADFPRGNSSVIGTFTASGDTQDIMIIAGTDNGVDPGLSGFILTNADGNFISASNVGRTTGEDIVLSTTPAAPLTVEETNLDGDEPAMLVTDGSFGDDALTFSDRTHEHNAAEFDADGLLTTAGGTAVPLPSYLVGNNYVKFANNARDQAGYSATITAVEPAYWYLLLDNRIDGPAGTTGSPNTSDPVLGGGFQWVIDGGWQRVNTGISPNGQADYTGVDESGDGGLNQFYSVWTLPEPSTSVTVNNNGVGGSNMIALVVGTEASPTDPGNGGGGDGDRLPPLLNVGTNDEGFFGVTLPEGVTGDFEYSLDLMNWEVITEGATGTNTDTNPDHRGQPAGFYRVRQ